MVLLDVGTISSWQSRSVLKLFRLFLHRQLFLNNGKICRTNFLKADYIFDNSFQQLLNLAPKQPANLRLCVGMVSHKYYPLLRSKLPYLYMLPIVEGELRGLQRSCFHEGKMTFGAKICFWRKISKLNSISVPKTKMTQNTIQMSSLEE